ncbi:hypothetical protein, partial [Ruminococcus difficilis]|uniref:hypothetical protein n=1 Tax=Ruminococcus difficilis TaxID=2763069 RepID=UPI001A9C4085
SPLASPSGFLKNLMKSGLSSILPLIPRKIQYPYSIKTAYQIQADFVEAEIYFPLFSQLC